MVRYLARSFLGGMKNQRNRLTVKNLVNSLSRCFSNVSCGGNPVTPEQFSTVRHGHWTRSTSACPSTKSVATELPQNRFNQSQAQPFSVLSGRALDRGGHIASPLLLHWAQVDLAQCNGKAGMVTCCHEAATKSTIDALAYCPCGPLEGGLL